MGGAFDYAVHIGDVHVPVAARQDILGVEPLPVPVHTFILPVQTHGNVRDINGTDASLEVWLQAVTVRLISQGVGVRAR